MPDTREKLLEAKYFLKRMKEKQYDRGVFKYTLSAFLATARSVTFIMQEEFGNVHDFKNWYNKKQPKMQNDKTMRLLNDKRVMTIHQQPVRPCVHVNISVNEHVTISESTSIVITHADGTVEKRESEPTPPPTPTKAEATMKWRWYFDELSEKDVVTICKEHIVKLETLVAECESQFISQSNNTSANTV